LPGSAQLAAEFADHDAFGFLCGPRSKVTVVDMDDTDSAILQEGERLFGPSPLLWQTGGGKFAAAYRFNGERRRIRPLPGIPVDLLGGGFVVAPPSMGAKRQYEIIRGSLEDLDRLPVANIPSEIAAACAPAGRAIPKGKRNQALFQYCKRTVSLCDTLDQLVDAARTWADNSLMEPLPAAEVMKTCNSVWKYRGGRKRIMHNVVEPGVWEAMKVEPYTLALFTYLGAENGPDADFWIADGLCGSLPWPRDQIKAARKRLIKLGIVRCVRPPGYRRPAVYNWITHPNDIADQAAARASGIRHPVGNPYSPSPLSPACWSTPRTERNTTRLDGQRPLPRRPPASVRERDAAGRQPQHQARRVANPQPTAKQNWRSR
jgi:hypothetical protein